MAVIADGEWVEIIDHDYEGCKGYVKSYSKLYEVYHVHLIMNRKGNQINRLLNFSEECVAKIPLELDKEDFQSMINLALDTKDEKWFRKLIKRVDRVKTISYHKDSY